MKRFLNRDDTGFTLVELLVVMAILGILAGIALPATLGQRSKGYRAAMKGALHDAVTAEEAWATGQGSYTEDPAALQGEGYRPTPTVTLHLKLGGSGYLACTSHPGVVGWLVYDSATASSAMAATDCAA